MRFQKLAFGLMPILMTACGEYVDSIANNVNEDLAAIKNKINGSCATNSEGDIWYSSKDQSYYRCTNGSWVQTTIEATPSEPGNVYPIDTTTYNNPNPDFVPPIFIPRECDENGDKYKLTKDWSIYQCLGGSWVQVYEDWNMPIYSSSSTFYPIYSSNSEFTIIPIDPMRPTYIDNEMWRGDIGEYRIDTGTENYYENAGYWYSFTDNADGGSSRIIWPAELGNEYDADAMDPVIDYCGGVCGTFQLDKGSITYNPFAGVGFTVDGYDDATGAPNTANVSQWGGICLSYASSVAMRIEMGLGDYLDAELGYDLPSVNLPKSNVGTSKCFTWSNFKQAGWGKSKISGDEASTTLANIRFYFQAASGTTGTFNIMSIGRYNDKPGAPVTPNKGLYWDGSAEKEHDLTSEEKTNLWYSISDYDDGGNSKFEWSFLSCDQGVCGDYKLNKGKIDYNPFVGLVYNVNGIGKYDEPIIADRSDWYGLCVTYTADNAISLELNPGEDLSTEIGFDLPSVTLPKTKTPSTVCEEWSNFKQAGWGKVKLSGADAAASLESIQFRIQATSGTKGSFNIQEIISIKN